MLRSNIIRAVVNSQSVSRVLSNFKGKVPLLLKSGKDALLNRTIALNNWYTKVLGLDEVKIHQNRVVTLQERLLHVQEKRRETGRDLAEIRKKSNQLQDEIHKVKRQEDLQKFLDLMREETEILKLEAECARTFQDYDQSERELFTAFTNAVRDSHEKQRAQLEYTKYFGIILSIAGSFLAFFYSTMKKSDLKRFIEERINAGSIENRPIASVVYTKNDETFLNLEGIQQQTNAIRLLLLEEQERNRFFKLICYSVIILVCLRTISN